MKRDLCHIFLVVVILISRGAITTGPTTSSLVSTLETKISTETTLTSASTTVVNDESNILSTTDTMNGTSDKNDTTHGTYGTTDMGKETSYTIMSDTEITSSGGLKAIMSGGTTGSVTYSMISEAASAAKSASSIIGYVRITTDVIGSTNDSNTVTTDIIGTSSDINTVTTDMIESTNDSNTITTDVMETTNDSNTITTDMIGATSDSNTITDLIGTTSDINTITIDVMGSTHESNIITDVIGTTSDSNTITTITGDINTVTTSETTVTFVSVSTTDYTVSGNDTISTGMGETTVPVVTTNYASSTIASKIKTNKNSAGTTRGIISLITDVTETSLNTNFTVPTAVQIKESTIAVLEETNSNDIPTNSTETVSTGSERTAAVITNALAVATEVTKLTSGRTDTGSTPLYNIKSSVGKTTKGMVPSTPFRKLTNGVFSTIAATRTSDAASDRNIINGVSGNTNDGNAMSLKTSTLHQTGLLIIVMIFATKFRFCVMLLQI